MNNFKLADLDWQDILNVSSHFDGMGRKSWGWGMGVTRLWNNKPQGVDPGISKPGALSRRGRTFWIWGLFFFWHLTYSHIPYLFVVREEKNIYSKHCMLSTINLYAYYAVKIFKKKWWNPQFFFQTARGEGAGGAWSWIRLCRHTYNSKYARVAQIFFMAGMLLRPRSF